MIVESWSNLEAAVLGKHPRGLMFLRLQLSTSWPNKKSGRRVGRGGQGDHTCISGIVCNKHVSNNIQMYMYAYRNITKKAKTTRHEKKAYMQQLRCAGATVGEYVGNGQGETERTETKDGGDEDTSVGSSDDANPLLILMIVRQLASVSTVSTSQRSLPR